jgi:hypothetical protein
LSVRRHPKGDTASRGTPRKPGRSSRPTGALDDGNALNMRGAAARSFLSLAIAGAVALAAAPLSAKEHRSREVTREFQREHPCPSTGKKVCSCSGSQHDPDGLTAPTPRAVLNCCRGGIGVLFVVGKSRRDLKARPIFGLVFPEEAAGMDIAALYSFDHPLRDLSSRIVSPRSARSAATASCYLQYSEVDLSGFRRAWVAN